MSTTALTTIAIAGITGSLGRLIAEYLLAKSNVRINALCRTPSKLPQWLRDEPRLVVHAASSTDITAIRDALKGADVAICCYLDPKSLMVDGQKRLIDACIAEGVSRYIAGDWSMDFRKLEFGQHPPKDPMKLVQAYLEEKEAAGQIKAVHVLNACFLELPWVGIWDAEGHRFKYWGSGDEKWEFTSYRNAAQFTAEVAVDKDAVGWFSFRGDHISIKEIAVDFQAIYGEEPELERLGGLDDLYKLMHEIRDQHPGNVKAWLGLFYTYYSLNGQTVLPLPLDNARYPNVKLVTVRDFFAKTPKERLGDFGILQS